MAIAPIPAIIPVQQIDPIAASDAYRDAPILQARVTEMISDTLARLSIEGQMVDVATSRPLPVGTTLALKGEWRDGQLRLVMQDPAALAASTGTASQGVAAQAPVAGQNAPVPTQQITVTGPTQPTLSSHAVPTPAAPAQTAQQSAAQPSPSALSPVRTAMAHIQAMAVEAMLDGVGSEQTQATQKPAVPIQAPADLAARQPLTEGAGARARAVAGLTAALMAEPLASEPAEEAAAGQKSTVDPATRLPLPEATAPRPQANAPATPAAGQQAPMAEKDGAAAEKNKGGHGTAVSADAPPSSDAPRAERLATATVQLPLYLPGSEGPLRLQITREERESEGGDEEQSQRDPSWIVRFSSETGQLGMIHAAISLVDGHVGVQLWAEQDDTAAWFRDHAGQLRDALVASDLDLDAVRISHGNPLTLEGN